MKIKRELHRILLAALLALPAAAGAQVIVDDFGSYASGATNTLGPYTVSTVVQQGGSVDARNFSIAGGRYVIDYNQSSANGNARQFAYLRNDYTLAVGGYIELTIQNTDLGVGTRDQTFTGLAISAGLTPTDRSNMIYLTMNAANQFKLETNGAASGGTIDLVDNTATSYILRLTRTQASGNDIYTGYYSADGGANFLTVGTAISRVTGTYTPTAIGFITGNSRNTSLATQEIDNLTVSIPEPSTYAMLGAGLGVLWLLRRGSRSGRAEDAGK